MNGPIILAGVAVALITVGLLRDRKVWPVLRLVWDLLTGVLFLVLVACYVIAPKQVRPTRRLRLLPRREIPRGTIFRRRFPVR